MQQFYLRWFGLYLAFLAICINNLPSLACPTSTKFVHFAGGLFYMKQLCFFGEHEMFSWIKEDAAMSIFLDRCEKLFRSNSCTSALVPLRMLSLEEFNLFNFSIVRTASIGHPLEWTEITGNQVENSWRIDGQRAQKLYFFPHQKNAHAVAGSCTPWNHWEINNRWWNFVNSQFVERF